MKTKIFTIATIAGVIAGTGTARGDDIAGIYEKECVKCHGADGKGDTKMGRKTGVKDYTDPKVQAELKDDHAFKAIKEGIKDKEDKTLMKPAQGLTDDQIKALVAHFRTFKK
jgi:cytochrome c6